jgi:hypothetical protein
MTCQPAIAILFIAASGSQGIGEEKVERTLGSMMPTFSHTDDLSALEHCVEAFVLRQ